MRAQLLEKIQRLVQEDDSVPPVVELDEYFLDNSEEYSIAPNQVDYGRPSLADLYEALKTIRQRPDVQAVLVGIHGDWVEALKHSEVWPAAENIHIYSSARRSEVEQWVSTFAADGVVKGWPYGKHPSAPKPRDGFQVFTVCWD